MLTRQQKIDAIYEKIANKELEFGCWLDSGRNDGYLLDTSRYLVEKSEGKYELYESYTNNKITDIVKIIGHPVLIGDVMDYFENIALDKIYNYIGVKKEEIPHLVFEKNKDTMMKIFPLWKQKRLPIEDQSDECIDFVFGLISK